MRIFPIIKKQGTTPTEKFLKHLCEKTFLSLWSYPNIYRNKKQNASGDGKEICDLLVVFGNHIIIFSDKHCKFPKSGNIEVDWQRWFRRAVVKSANQVWGAERWIKQFPNRIFLDNSCSKKIPINIPDIKEAKFHLIVVAHGVSKIIKKAMGGSGSLMIDSTIKQISDHNKPFTVGNLDSNKTFIHILDDDFLLTLMKTRDTVSDFIEYLDKKEKLISSETILFAAGEEELLSIYLKNMNSSGEHDFVFPEKYSGIALIEGQWNEFQNNPQRIAQIEEDKISYMWDSLIETFSDFALKGEQHFVSDGGISDTERILRFMASAHRFKRRYYAQCLHEMLQITSEEQRRLRVIPPLAENDPHYVFLLFPLPKKEYKISESEYRIVRRNYLQSCCMVTKLKFPDATDIIGIATESGINNQGRSEDAMYLDASKWNEKLEKKAQSMQKELEILVKPVQQHVKVSEYPLQHNNLKKNPRNKPCHCGSGKKYKKCCINK